MAAVTNPRADPPRHRAWWQGAVVYEIYPRSFADADGDGVGDLRGVVAHLDYLASGPDGLGVDAIWLTPFYPSGGVDGGYDVTDYCRVDPAYGTLEDFDHLVAQAHRRGLRVIVDWVPNHTSDRHPWFVEARASREAPRRDWYVWADGRDGEPPNNWLSAFDEVGPAWSYDDATGQWYLHSYSAHQPDLNWDNPSLRAAMADVLRCWLRRGVDGFRIDAADGLGKDPERADNPWPITKPTRESAGRRHDEDWDTIFERLAELRHVADGFSDRLLVGEVYVLDQARLAEYVAPGRLHLAHDFSLMREAWSADGFRRIVETHEAVAPGRRVRRVVTQQPRPSACRLALRRGRRRPGPRPPGRRHAAHAALHAIPLPRRRTRPRRLADPGRRDRRRRRTRPRPHADAVAKPR
jgi:alpha-glucosidase